MSQPDILYAVRPGEQNEPLRLSLRSLGNLPHRRVFIAGYCPDWVQGVTAIPVQRRPNKFEAIEQNVRLALRHPELAEDVVYMNDDFYITEPIDEVPVMHGGPIAEYNGRGELKARMRNTNRALETYTTVERVHLAFDGIHTPMPLKRYLANPLLEACKRLPAVLWRTWYGNACDLHGERVEDAKRRGEPGPLRTFTSSNGKGLQTLREELEDVLPKESPYVSA